MKAAEKRRKDAIQQIFQNKIFEQVDIFYCLDAQYESWEDFKLVDRLSELANVSVPNAIDEIRTAPVLHNHVCEVGEMETVVKTILGV